MINLILGRSGSGKSYEIKERLKKTLNETDRKVLLIVPEQQTVVWESEIAKETSERDILRIEVTNFTRLANTVFRTYGDLRVDRCGDSEKILVLYKTLRRLKMMKDVAGESLLKVYTSPDTGRDAIRGDDRFIPQLLSAVNEFRQEGITPSDLENASNILNENSETSEGEILSKRIGDLSLILSQYNTVLNESFRDRNDILRALSSMLSKHGIEFFRGKDVFIDSFFTMTPVQIQIVELMMRFAENFTMSFIYDTEAEIDGNKNRKNHGIQFAEVEEFYRSIYSHADEIAMSDDERVNVISLTENRRHENAPELKTVEKEMFSFGKKATEEIIDENEKKHRIKNAIEKSRVNLILCADRYEEAEACASVIERLVRRDKCRYSDIAVVARDMTTRSGIIDSALRRHNIPCFMSCRSPVSDTSIIRLLTSVLDVISNNWQRKDVIRLIKTGLLPYENYECDLFEEYIETWLLRGRSIYSNEWTMNPQGNRTGDVLDWAKSALGAVNRVREGLYDSIERLSEVFGGSTRARAKIEDICAAIVNFCFEMAIPEKIARVAEEIKSDGYIQDGRTTEQLWEKLCGIFDDMVSILGSAKGGDDSFDSVEMNVNEFRMLFMYICDSIDIGTIPSSIDEIELGSSDSVRFKDIKHLILIGANEGEFPANTPKNGLFSNSELKMLSDCGISLANDDSMNLAREYFMYYRTATLPSETLTVLVPSSDGEPSLPSKKIAELVSDGEISAKMKYGDIPVEYRVYSSASYINALNNASSDMEKELIRSLPDAERLKHYNDLMKVADEVEKERLNREKKRRNKKGLSAFDVMSVPEKYIGELPEINRDMSLSSENEKIGDLALYEIFKDKNRIYITQSKLNTFEHCPYMYWVKYGMGIEPQAKGDLAANEVGTFVHDILENFFREISKDESITMNTIGDADIDSRIERLVNDYVSKLPMKGGNDTGRRKYLISRLSMFVTDTINNIITEFRQSKFEPIAFELPIGTKKENSDNYVTPVSINYDGDKTVMLEGVIDRVDRYVTPEGETFIRVVDYKTGSKEFKLEKVTSGEDVQLMLYLYSLLGSNATGTTESENARPAGVLYYSIPIGSGTTSSVMLDGDEDHNKFAEAIKRTGFVVDDADVQSAWDSEGGYLLKYDKKGNSSFISGNQKISEEDILNLIREQMNSSIGREVKKITSGVAGAKPRKLHGDVKSPCEYCEFYKDCRREKNNA